MRRPKRFFGHIDGTPRTVIAAGLIIKNHLRGLLLTGKGAQGAGYYPPLADNSKMQSKYYIISVVVNGLRGMPSFHSMMSDEQIAAVTQYVHSDLNKFTDKVTDANVAQLRHDFPPGSDPSE